VVKLPRVSTSVGEIMPRNINASEALTDTGSGSLHRPRSVQLQSRQRTEAFPSLNRILDRQRDLEERQCTSSSSRPP
jgi:hypothetical protein